MVSKATLTFVEENHCGLISAKMSDPKSKWQSEACKNTHGKCESKHCGRVLFVQVPYDPYVTKLWLPNVFFFFFLFLVKCLNSLGISRTDG